MRIIVNADDLGLSKEVNDHIFAFMSRGVVTSATILANGPAFDDAMERVPLYSHCSFGVHLNVAEFCPLMQDQRLAPIMNESGEFSGRVLSRFQGNGLGESIFNEWCAQVEKIKAHGVHVSHLDSHLHFHTLPALFGALKGVQKRFGLRKVRNTRNIYAPSALVSKTLLLKKWLWGVAVRQYFFTKTTSGFTDLTTFLEVAGRKRFPHADIEVMVHPGNSRTPRFIAETKVLQTDWLSRIPVDCELISYHEL